MSRKENLVDDLPTYSLRWFYDRTNIDRLVYFGNENVREIVRISRDPPYEKGPVEDLVELATWFPSTWMLPHELESIKERLRNV